MQARGSVLTPARSRREADSNDLIVVVIAVTVSLLLDLAVWGFMAAH
jgi:hypothetical protein